MFRSLFSTISFFVEDALYFARRFYTNTNVMEPDMMANGKLITRGGTGLTSCLNVILATWFKYNRVIGTQPTDIDYSNQFVIYNEEDKAYTHVVGNYIPGCNYSRKLKYYNHNWQFRWYDDIAIDELSRVGKHVIPISKEVYDTSVKISTRIGSRTCVLYRGNDKEQEIPSTPYDSIIEMAKDTGTTSFFLQSDEQEFVDYFKKQFPDTVTYDEIPRISRNINSTSMPITNKIKFAVNFNAVLYAIAQAEKVILTTGNTGEFVCIYRGNISNIWQFHGLHGKWKRLG